MPCRAMWRSPCPDRHCLRIRFSRSEMHKTHISPVVCQSQTLPVNMHHVCVTNICFVLRSWMWSHTTCVADSTSLWEERRGWTMAASPGESNNETSTSCHLVRVSFPRLVLMLVTAIVCFLFLPLVQLCSSSKVGGYCSLRQDWNIL